MDTIVIYNNENELVEVDQAFHLFLREYPCKRVRLSKLQIKNMTEYVLSDYDRKYHNLKNVKGTFLTCNCPIFTYNKPFRLSKGFSVFDEAIKDYCSLTYEQIIDKEQFEAATEALKEIYSVDNCIFEAGLFDSEIEGLIGYMIVETEDNQVYILFFGYFLDKFLRD